MIDCQTCGACCRGFTVEVDVQDEVHPRLVKQALFGPVMRERCGQCIALKGEVGKQVRCTIYEDRPQVCREFEQGSAACDIARHLQRLPALLVHLLETTSGVEA